MRSSLHSRDVFLCALMLEFKAHDHPPESLACGSSSNFGRQQLHLDRQKTRAAMSTFQNMSYEPGDEPSDGTWSYGLWLPSPRSSRRNLWLICGSGPATRRCARQSMVLRFPYSVETL